MSDLLRKLAFYICKPIYKTIPNLYEIFYYLSTRRFFEEGSDTLNTLSSNIYVLISVVMLFAFSATMLAAIVNPDLIEDKKKGVGAIFKRAIIGIVLIVAIPFAFNKAYDIQKQIIDSHLIEKVLVGMNIADNATNNSFMGGNGGNVIAGSLISSVLHPDEDLMDEDGKVTIEAVAGSSPATAYNNMVKDIKNMGGFSSYLNASPQVEGTSVEYAFEFNGIIAIIAGLAADYILLIFAIDMAVRLFELAFYELTAPISVMAYIAVGGDTFTKWAKAVGAKFAEVFVRVGAMAFYLFLISQLDEFINNRAYSGGGVDGIGWKLLLKLLLIIGLLIFVKKVPDIVKKAFGVDISTSGGIKGRLESMAGVGKQAAAAWDKMKQLGKVGAGVVAAGAVTGAAMTTPLGWGLAAGAAGGTTLWKKKLRDTTFGQKTKAGLSELGRDAKTIGKVAGGFAGAGGLIKGIKEGKKAFEETDYGKQKKYEHEVNKEAKIKAKVLAEIEAACNGISGLHFKVDPKTGNMVLDMDKILSADASTANFANMVKAGKFSKVQSDALTDYNEKQNSLMVAQNNQTYTSEIRRKLESAMEAAGTATEKQEISKMLTKLDTGAYKNRSDLVLDFNAYSSNVALQNVKTEVMGDTAHLTSFESAAQLTANVTKAQRDFDKASEKLDKSIDAAATAESKQALKEMKGNSEKMNKKNTHTL